jgi:hypothetical protein
MCCRRYGHVHRPALITKAHKPSHPCRSSRYFPRYSGDSWAGRVLAPWPADPRSFAVDHPLFLQRMQLLRRMERSPGSKPACQPTAPGRSTPNTGRSRNHPPQCRSASNSARRYRSSRSRSATARSPRSSSRIRSRNRYGQPIRSAFAVAGIRGNGRNSSRIRGSNASTSDPAAARTYLGGPKLATAAFTVFREHPTTRGCRRHV